MMRENVDLVKLDCRFMKLNNMPRNWDLVSVSYKTVSKTRLQRGASFFCLRHLKVLINVLVTDQKLP